MGSTRFFLENRHLLLAMAFFLGNASRDEKKSRPVQIEDALRKNDARARSGAGLFSRVLSTAIDAKANASSVTATARAGDRRMGKWSQKLEIMSSLQRTVNVIVVVGY